MRAPKGAIRKMSSEYLDRYVIGSKEKHDIREADTAGQPSRIARRMDGKRLRYQSLIASNGLSSGARVRIEPESGIPRGDQGGGTDYRVRIRRCPTMVTTRSAAAYPNTRST